ncbi:uncharacterized protein LTR77_004963 [Saxophila tyrrhenica]|uniref:NmrA-like domain-containing protein n=1 Tax=Saxophila tyrrhenica TaxID=1690608 RepID=A0AAV9PAQ3_9PEZI|nr:hypothetical protein LTR77_004963 [Saxophila tyrrhenica]
MAPSILIVGATGNTGRSVVETLPGLTKNTELSSHRIIALTRSSKSPAAQQLAKIDRVEVVEQNWIEITSDWLREHEVNRIFIAPHNEPTQFAEEGQFHVSALQAGVKYVVRISTTAANVHPNYPAYYPRTHWAIEAMLSQPEFKSMQWTSLQPNVFFSIVFGPSVEMIKNFRKTGKQGTLSILLDEDTPTGVIDPHEIGVLAAHLLAQKDTSPHNNKRYVLNGPEDITGAQVVKMVEKQIGEPVKDVKFKDVSFIDQWADSVSGSKNLIRTVKFAPVTSWEGKAMAETTSKEVLELYAPKRTAGEALEQISYGDEAMARGGGKPTSRPKGQARRTSAKDSTEQGEEADSSIALKVQQLCLDIFKNALKPESGDQGTLQEVKGHLYNRDFATAFGKEEYLRVYASRWSPSRALAYIQVFRDIEEHLDVHQDNDLHVACLGGGAGGELVALAGWHSTHLDAAHEGSFKNLHLRLIDIANWFGVTQSLLNSVTSPPELSKYASQAKKDANKPLVCPENLDVVFQQQDVLHADHQTTAAFAETVKGANLTTFMFTLNELYSTSVAKTQRLLAQLTEAMSVGACLLVVDSPGSYSTVSINGTEKRYPMQWLVDHTLLARGENDASGAKWEKVLSDDSRWFRLAETLHYPIDLENMRYQIHLYRRLGDVGG